jgi:isocitrate dehydrogenase
MPKNAHDKSKLAEQYDKFASKFKEQYLEGKDRGREAMAEALDKAHHQLTALGEFSSEYGDELKQFLTRDLEQTIVVAKHLGAEAKDHFNPARLGAGALASLAQALELSGDALHALSDKTEQSLTYKTGEMTTAGTLTCQLCGQQVYLKATGHVPPCPKCQGIHFRKGY